MAAKYAMLADKPRWHYRDASKTRQAVPAATIRLPQQALSCAEGTSDVRPTIGSRFFCY
jgi:hypothetical protein